MSNVLVRTSERRTFTTCRQLWWWSYVEQLRPKTDAPAFRFGSLVHKAMELRYPPGIKRGPHPAETFWQLYEAELEEQEKFGFRDEEGTWQEAGQLGVSLLEEFVNTYGDDPQYEVIGSEMTFRVRIADGLTYVGTFDGVWRDRGNRRLFLKEWKTATQIWADHLPLDEQAGSYWAFAPPYLRKRGILGPGENLAGILYTFLRKSKPDDRPRNREGLYLNKDGSISKRQPAPLFVREMAYRDKYERDQIRARSIAQMREMAMVRSGELGLYKNPSSRNCRGCPFLIPCELHETGAEYKLALKGGYKKYDPYDAHEIREESVA